jgi:putative sigma-54 modulation protein
MPNKKNFSEDDDYNIHIDGRHVQVTDAMKEYALTKLSKIERFHAHIMDIHVTMDIQKIEHSVSIVVKSDHFKIKSHATSSDMYASIDQAVDRLQKQISKWKEKIQEHHSKNLASVDIKVNVIQRPYDEVEEFNAEIEAEKKAEREKRLMPGHVLGEKTIPLKDLLMDEAIMKMELSGDPFLLYRSQEDLKVKVMYRRDDGNYGIIHTQ